MAELTPVPAPRSPFDGWRGWVVSVIVIGVLVAVAKPWGSRPVDTALASPSPSPIPTSVPVVAPPIGLVFDPAVLGADLPAPEWALLAPTGRHPLDVLDAEPDGVPSETTTDDTPIVAGPVIELGSSDDPGAFAITHPTEVSLAAIRLWHFVDDGSPRRVDLARLAAPWRIRHAEVLAHRHSSMESGRVLPWDPGLYRLDLLVEPAGSVRSVMLSVREGRTSTASAGGEPSRSEPSFEQATLGLLPQSANLWSIGRFLSGWYRESSRPDCRVAEIWRSTDPSDECWPIPLGGTEALGVNLPGPETVTAIGLRQVDPLPGAVAGEAMLAVDGRAGLALVRAPADGLADGIYRLDVTTARDAELTWYFEIGPIGRAVAQYYQSSLSR